ncbi:glycoside hydrolase family 28 protein [Flavobacterium chungbukense]|uniref:Glycoside hydrolase family 28 protein n=1 Tax=Flavobacterium chungbukense TaxID=877464 RepID=A0ABP7Y7R7_9FLAO|nr:glycoside hydrolase family 28 protein [Flavobacterium chungbukense]MCC4923820.1 glycoside hydrolase family 28 protein [Flavobacterium chungbukense]
MKKIILCTALVFSFVFLSFKKNYSCVTLKEVNVKAPFEMPAIKIPDFSNCKEFLITDFGAVAGDLNKTSEAISKAITKASKSGGGTVVIPEGEWLTKKIHFKSNVNLHLKKGAVLLFSENPKDYLPAVRSTWEGYECYNYSPLIYAYQCKNIAITGEGELKAKMDVWKQWFARPKAHMESLKRLYYLASYNKPMKERQMVNDTANFRPQFIQFNRCENILMEGVTITNSPFWTIHPFLSKDVVLRNLNVYAHGHNNDGVDPEMSQNVLIENCVFDQGDDAIAIKSGSNQDAWRLNTPSKNIVMRNCTVKNGHQLVAIGSELSGGIENVFIDNCTVVDGAKLNHLLFIKTNERRGGYVKNIHMTNITSGKIDEGILGIETDVLYQWRNLVPTIERRLTPIQNVYLENVKATNVKFVSRILGQKELPVENIFFKNVTAQNIQGEKSIHENVKNFNAPN